MNNKEAIEAIRNNWPDERYSMLREALDIAISAIDKQIPKYMTDYWKCPACECDFTPNEHLYCPDCGQRLEDFTD